MPLGRHVNTDEQNAPSDRPLSETERKELAASLRVGLKVARLEPTATPDQVQAQLNGIINGLRKNPPPTDKLVNLSLALGCLWADAVVRELGWEWAFVTKRRVDVYAIVSPDRAYCVFPMMYAHSIVGGTTANQNCLLLYNMLKAGKLPPSEPGRYLSLG